MNLERIPIHRRDVYACVGLCSVLLILALCRLQTDICGAGHDDGIYALSAKGLAEGKGYRVSHIPGEPAQTKYPVLFPALLAIVWKIWPTFPDNVIGLTLIPLFSALASIALFYLYQVRFGYASRRTAFFATLLCITTFAFSTLTFRLFSEMTFILLTLLCLWWTENCVRNESQSVKNDLFGGLLLGLPFLCRSIGIVLFPAVLLYLWQRKRRVRFVGLGLLICVLPWILWSWHAQGSWKNEPVQAYYTDYVGWWLGSGLPKIFKVVGANATSVILLSGTLSLNGITLALIPIGMALWTLMCAGLGLIIFGRLLYGVSQGRLPALWISAYLGLVVIWPWFPLRFFVPILPFLLIYFLQGSNWILTKVFAEPVRLRVALTCVAVALTANVMHTTRLTIIERKDETPFPSRPNYLTWSHMEQTLDWIKQHSEADTVIAASNDPVISLYTGRTSYYPVEVPPLKVHYHMPVDEERIFNDSLKGIEAYQPKYLVVTPNVHGEDHFREWLARLQSRYPKNVQQRFTVKDDPRFAIYELKYPLTAIGMKSHD